ncbi:MAG: polysaccharide biosynthesis tyrosine autokinase, partial [Bacteroidota bacterium]
LEFIDQRVISLVNELDSVEGGIQSYKSANEIIGNNASASMDYTLSEIRSAVQQISEYDIQKKMLESLESFLLKEGNGYELIPANLIAENPVLSGLVNQFNGLVLQYNKVAVTASERNPARLAMEDQMGDIRKLILQTIQNLKQDIQIPISRIEQNIQGLKRSLSSVPGIEKRLVEKMRTREVKEKLFLFLLQRREETALSEAITTAKTRTIDRARTPRFPVYPKRRMVLMASTLLGLLIPFIGVMLIGLFDTKIDSEESIQQHTSIPILGRIALAKNKERIVVRQGRRSAINEMFRLIRTKLNFINHNIDTQCMLVTSSISGEGKTFIALNLGITLALADKKVVLLGMDLRKPKLGSYLQMNTNKGITNYLIGESPLEEIIQAYPDQPNLSFIASGPVPPNPAELILSDQMSNMINQLKERYDYVLIDTPPVGLVSDALLLRKFVNNVLVVVHYKVTRKAMLRNLEKMYQEGEIEKASIIFNGVKKSKSYYGYGGYKQDYYVDED